MALSPKDRERIIEEETLRYKTRQDLHAQACASHPRRGRWLRWVAGAIFIYALWCWMACGAGMGGWGMHGWGGHCASQGMSKGKACKHSMMESDDAEDEANPPAPVVPKAK